MKPHFWLELGIVIALTAFLLVRRRKSRKTRVIQSLYRQGANDCATLHPFDLQVVHDATIHHDLDHLQAQEAYRRGYLHEDARLALRDLAVVKAQLNREANRVRHRPARQSA
jgi:hypothetical protein